MTQRDLTTGITARRVKRVVVVSTRYVIMIAALSGAFAHAVLGQRSLVAIALPTDTSGMRKVLPPTPPKKSAFAQTQLMNARVLEARVAKRLELKKVFRDRGITYPAAEIFMRVFKREHQLEMWVRPEGQDTFALLKTYEICALNDLPGPKRVQGDERTPEGFYFIDNFNPQSGYYLSLRVNYPNESDVALGKTARMGGDVFIHGGCKTAGCVAVTNENIKEIYWLAVEARDNGQTRIPVHIFPARLHDNGLRLLANVFDKQPDLVRFWSNLKGGYDYFDQYHKLPTVEVNARGRYVFNRDPSKPTLLGKSVGPATDTVAVPQQ